MDIFLTLVILLILIFFGIKITSFLFRKGKESYDDSVIGMSMKLKKEQLRKELDAIEKQKNNPDISSEYINYLNNLHDTKQFYTDNSFEGVKKEYEEFYHKELTEDEYHKLMDDKFNEAQDIWNFIMSSTGTINNDRTGALRMSKWCEENLTEEDLRPIQEMAREVSQKISQYKIGMKVRGDIFSEDELNEYKRIYDTYWNLYQEAKK